jgi:ribonuclease P protein subunit RPR2
MNLTTKQIARRRIAILFLQAKKTYETNPELARNYVKTARKIAMAARVRLPTDYKRSLCKKCNTLLVPGKTSRIRTKPKRESHIVVTCLNCGSPTRIPIKTRNKIEEN